jgi:hypothetical protein
VRYWLNVARSFAFVVVLLALFALWMARATGCSVPEAQARAVWPCWRLQDGDPVRCA